MNAFHSRIINIYKRKGRVWSDELPQLVITISSKLELRDLKAVANLTYNYVLSGFQGDNPIILKLGLDNVGLKREAFALKCFASCRAVKVLAEDNACYFCKEQRQAYHLKVIFKIQSRNLSKLHARL